MAWHGLAWVGPVLRTRLYAVQQFDNSCMLQILLYADAVQRSVFRTSILPVPGEACIAAGSINAASKQTCRTRLLEAESMKDVRSLPRVASRVGKGVTMPNLAFREH